MHFPRSTWRHGVEGIAATTRFRQRPSKRCSTPPRRAAVWSTPRSSALPAGGVMARRGSRWLRRAFLIGLGMLFVGFKTTDSGFGVRLILAGVVLVAVPVGVWWR